MDSRPAKKNHKSISSPIQPRVNDFQKNDLQLLQSGMLADGTIKCQGRTWKVHRSLLSSRLKWFKSAFCGSFAEATTREIDLPEATPDSVDIAIRHLYGEDLDLEALDTPLLCVCSWKLADYLQLDALKLGTYSALQEHLNAMLLLSSSNHDLETTKPIWLTHFMDAFREVCAHAVLQPLRSEFVAFLWIARFQMLGLNEIWETLDNYQDVRDQLNRLLIWHRFPDRPDLVPWNWHGIEKEIQAKNELKWEGTLMCSYCGEEGIRGWDSEKEEPTTTAKPWFHNPLPMISDTHKYGRTDIGEMT